MSLRITSVTCRIVDHAIRRERMVVSSAGTHDESQFLEVTVTEQSGMRGFGEAATVPLWSGESARTAKAIVETLFAPRLKGATIDHPREALAILDAATVYNPFTKSAIEIAVWDVWARLQGKRVVDLVADRTPPVSLPTRCSVGCYPPEKTVELARAFWEAGVRTLKFKTGAGGHDDVARLRAVRDALGDEPIFTIDANGGYKTADIAVKAVEALLPFRLNLVEQPTPRDRISMLAEVKKRVNVPILADEAIFTPDHLDEALDLNAFDLLSVYPGKNGGFSHSIDMAKKAQRAGKSCTIGSNLETNLGQAAMVSLAAALSAFPSERLASDFPGGFFYPNSSTKPDLTLSSGRVFVPTGAGFGVDPV